MAHDWAMVPYDVYYPRDRSDKQPLEVRPLHNIDRPLSVEVYECLAEPDPIGNDADGSLDASGSVAASDDWTHSNARVLPLVVSIVESDDRYRVSQLRQAARGRGYAGADAASRCGRKLVTDEADVKWPVQYGVSRTHSRPHGQSDEHAQIGAAG